jgi:fructuronate reductase
MTAPRRLSPASLAGRDIAVRPALDRRPDVGIVHLGIGAFHRAHQAAYTADALDAEPGPWGICGVAPRRPDAVDQLAPQDGLFSLLERGDDGDRLRVYAPVREVLAGFEAPERVVERLADPAVQVVTMTITERGYPRDPATGRLRDGDPELAADLGGRPPRTALGMLVRGLQARAAGGDAGPVTVVCCDNLPDNGAMLARLVEDFCARLPDGEGGPAGEWIAAHARFPSTVVDRIVPATTPADRAAATRALGLDDRAAVVAEPFREWVIEDAFASPRPAWERAGARLVADAAPFEALKLRLLNGTHSALAYLGLPAGAETVDEAVAHPELAAVARRLIDEDLAPTLRPAPGLEPVDYAAAMFERFRNRRIRHRLAQIAMDGSRKLPLRLLAPARARLEAGAEPRWIALVTAAWGMHLRGGADVHDELAEPARAALECAGDAAARARALLALDDVFGSELAGSERFRDLVADWLGRLEADGVARTLRAAT